MPEGHTIHRLARQLEDVFGGQRVHAESPQGRFSAGADRLDGKILESARAHGKQLFVTFQDEQILRVHLGLYGAWDFGGDATFQGASSIGAPRRIGENEAPGQAIAEYTGPPAPVGAVRLRLTSEHGWADLRGPSACEVLGPGEAELVLGRLGPDPLADLTSGESRFLEAVQRSARPIAALLMDQEVVAGIGNVYRAELLFRAELAPMTPGKSLSPEKVRLLWRDAAGLLARGVVEGRIVTTEPSHREDQNAPVAQASDAHYVYRRSELPCRICQTAVVGTELAGRNLFFCPGCQSA